jgi:hypothetical protein
MKILVVVFMGYALPEDGDRKALQNDGILPHHCTVSHPKDRDKIL